MQNKAQSSKTPAVNLHKNPLETFGEVTSSVGKGAAQNFKDMGAGIFDQLIGYKPPSSETPFGQEWGRNKFEQKAPPKKKVEKNLFNYQNYHETEIVKRQIKELTEQIKKEVDYLAKSNSSLLHDIKDIQTMTVNALPEKPGIYHIRFLEIILSLIRTLRAKIGESRTWLQAMMSKKKKRGSLFAARSKKMGTQYSMSQELSNSRSVQ